MTYELFHKESLPKDAVSVTVILPAKKYNYHMILFCYGGSKNFGRLAQIPFMDRFVNAGYGVACFDYRGMVRKSFYSQTGIRTRVEDGMLVAEFLRNEYNPRKLSVFGVSMGGPVASHVAVRGHADSLMLTAAAAYDSRAMYNRTCFGDEFKSAINKYESWRYSEVFALLRVYTKPSFLIWFFCDEVIPNGVRRLYESSLMQSTRRTLVLQYSHKGMYSFAKDKQIVIAGHCIEWLAQFV